MSKKSQSEQSEVSEKEEEEEEESSDESSNQSSEKESKSKTQSKSYKEKRPKKNVQTKKSPLEQQLEALSPIQYPPYYTQVRSFPTSQNFKGIQLQPLQMNGTQDRLIFNEVEGTCQQIENFVNSMQSTASKFYSNSNQYKTQYNISNYSTVQSLNCCNQNGFPKSCDSNQQFYPFQLSQKQFLSSQRDQNQTLYNPIIQNQNFNQQQLKQKQNIQDQYQTPLYCLSCKSQLISKSPSQLFITPTIENFRRYQEQLKKLNYNIASSEQTKMLSQNSEKEIKQSRKKQVNEDAQTSYLSVLQNLDFQKSKMAQKAVHDYKHRDDKKEQMKEIKKQDFEIQVNIPIMKKLSLNKEEQQHKKLTLPSNILDEIDKKSNTNLENQQIFKSQKSQKSLKNIQTNQGKDLIQNYFSNLFYHKQKKGSIPNQKYFRLQNQKFICQKNYK